MITSNYKQYKKELDKEIARQIEETKKDFRSFVFSLYNNITIKTPVDRGYLRTNNIISVGSTNSSQLDKIDTQTTLTTNALSLINELKVQNGTSVFIQNNLPYADRIEYQGWSKKAPQGFYRISLNITQRAVDKAKREVVKGRTI